MKAKCKFLPVMLALLFIVSSAWPVRAAGGAGDAYVQQMIQYYRSYPTQADTDLARLSEDLSEVDPTQAAAWENILDFWKRVNRELDIRSEALPDGLPNDDSLCIVVLGYQLNATGSMRSELVGRLKTALAAAEKYPNAFILCTGGGTARYNENATEAGRMADWLIRKGVDESRIIVEDQSLSTTQNAQYSWQILRERYPQVNTLALITSDYHLRRGCMCFYTQSVLGAYQDGGTLYEIAGVAGYPTYQASESISAQAADMAQIADIRLENLPVPTLSHLSYIAVEGQSVYRQGDTLSLSVTAVYDSGYRKVVTSQTDFSGTDLSRTGSQIVTVKYGENGYQATAAFKIRITASDDDAPLSTEHVEITGAAETVTAPTEAEEIAARSAVPGPSGPSPVFLLPVLAAGLALVTFVLRKHMPQKPKRRR